MADWFAPKRYGYGGGLPIAWQGWVVLGIYLAVVIGATQMLAHIPVAMFSVILTATAVFILIVVKNTRGGFRWRWGGKE
jgi:hypothetical protein